MDDSSIKLVCFDLNKTLIIENTWYELNVAMGMTREEDEELLRQYQNGEINYQQWQKVLEQKYISQNKATRQNIETSIYSYKYKSGARELINYLKSKGYTLFLLSGSIDLLVKRVATELEIEYFAANNSFVFNNDYLQEIVVAGEDSVFKVNQVKNLCKKLGIATSQCVCIGDGDNDKAVFELTGKGITFTGSQLADIAWKVVDDLISIKNIL